MRWGRTFSPALLWHTAARHGPLHAPSTPTHWETRRTLFSLVFTGTPETTAKVLESAMRPQILHHTPLPSMKNTTLGEKKERESNIDESSTEDTSKFGCHDNMRSAT